MRRSAGIAQGSRRDRAGKRGGFKTTKAKLDHEAKVEAEAKARAAAMEAATT